MTNDILGAFDDLIQQGKGIAASLLGEYNSVYRLNPRSSGSVISPVSQIYNIFPVKYERTVKRDITEIVTFDLLIFIGECDTTYLQFGDILRDNNTGQMYCYAQRRALMPPLFAGLEHMATLGQSYNPASSPVDTTVGAVFEESYGGAAQSITQPITLSNGSYAIGSVGDAPASIPVGIQQLNRLGQPHDSELTEQVLKASYMIYIPPLPGVAVRENTLVTIEDGVTQYVLTDVSISASGLVGTVCIAQKVGV